MLSYETLLTERRGDTLHVTINRPEALNAVNGLMMTEFGRLFSEDVPKREGLHGVILAGAGEKSFVAGADIKEFLALTGNQGREMSEKGQKIFETIERCSVPVVAAVQGYALGAGCELAMACHLRVAGAKARFGQPEVNLGLVPGYGGTQRLVGLVGRTRAVHMLLTAEIIDAEEAYRVGLVTAVVPQGQEVAAAQALVDRIAEKAPVAVAGIIESVNAFDEFTLDGFAAEVHNFGKCANTEDFREGAAAFVEKRKAAFRGL